MNILHVITGLESGGAERALFNLLTSSGDHSIKHLVISLSSHGVYGGRFLEKGIPVIALNLKRIKHKPDVFLSAYKEIKKFNPDLVQGWMYHGNLFAYFLARTITKKSSLIWNIRHSLLDIALEKRSTRHAIKLNRFFSSHVDTILYNSYCSKEQHEKLGFFSGSANVIPNGFDPAVFKFSNEFKSKIRNMYNIPHNAFVIGHVARFHPMKDHASFISACSTVLDSFKHIHVVMVGNNIDNSNHALVSNIPDANRHRFHLLGLRNNVHEIYSAIDCLCVSSSWGEAFPNVIGESMLCNVPCVATDVGDSRRIIGETGMVVPPKNIHSLANALITIINMEPNNLKELGKKARKKIESDFNIGKLSDNYRNEYLKLIH